MEYRQRRPGRHRERPRSAHRENLRSGAASVVRRGDLTLPVPGCFIAPRTVSAGTHGRALRGKGTTVAGKLSGLVSDFAEKVDRSVGWSRLPTVAAIPVLIGLRDRLREKNLYDTGRGRARHAALHGPRRRRHLGARTLDGTYNDLDDPLMGSLGSRFGRNVPLEHTYPEEPTRLLDPNPRLISRRAADARELPAGDDAQPAGRRLDPVRGARLVQPRPQRPDDAWEIPLEQDDPWPEHPMRILRTHARPEPRRRAGRRPTSRPTPTGGTARRSTAARRSSPTACAPTRAASSSIDDQGLPPARAQKRTST